jgi:hypothetical protein
VPDEAQNPPILPTRDQVKPTKEIEAQTPPIIARIDPTVKVGAAERSEGKPVDESLRKTLILGNRSSVKTATPLETTPVVRENTETNKPRDTGAIERPVKPREQKPGGETPPYVPPTRTEDRKVEPTEQKPEQPRYEPPARKETPRYEPPKSETPPYVPPTRRESPPEPKRESPPPPKSEPKSEPKPDKPSSPPLQKSGETKKNG